MNVHWTTTALDQLQAIQDYLVNVSELYAEQVTDTLITRSQLLADFPNRGRVVSEVKNPQIREVLVLHYRLVYYIGSTQIDILSVLHQAQART